MKWWNPCEPCCESARIVGVYFLVKGCGYPLSGATVVITDNQGQVAFSGITGPDGSIYFEILEGKYTQSVAWPYYEPHITEVEYGGGFSGGVVTMEPLGNRACLCGITIPSELTVKISCLTRVIPPNEEPQMVECWEPFEVAMANGLANFWSPGLPFYPAKFRLRCESNFLTGEREIILESISQDLVLPGVFWKFKTLSMSPDPFFGEFQYARGDKDIPTHYYTEYNVEIS